MEIFFLVFNVKYKKKTVIRYSLKIKKNITNQKVNEIVYLKNKMKNMKK